MDVTLEVCVGTLDDIKVCLNYPIDRIELTSALELGGLTASVGMLRQAKRICNLPMACMVRPHAASFVMDDDHFNVMMMDAKQLLENGADGIVFGCLTNENTINIEQTKAMVSLVHSYQKEAVFHKAFDQVKDIQEAIQTLVSLQVDRVLTEGGLNYSKSEKRKNLIYLCEHYQDHIQILIGGGVRSDNVLDLIQSTHTKQVHTSCKSIKQVDQVDIVYVDEMKVQAMIQALGRAPKKD